MAMPAVAASIYNSEQEAADHEVNVKLVKARAAARYFFKCENSEAKRHDFASWCAFARCIPGGSIRSIPTLDMEQLEIVGTWFFSLTEVNRFALIFQFDTIGVGVPWKRAREKYGWNRDKFNRRIESLLRDLGGKL